MKNRTFTISSGKEDMRKSAQISIGANYRKSCS